jgi:hypothetical protein
MCYHKKNCPTHKFIKIMPIRQKNGKERKFPLPDVLNGYKGVLTEMSEIDHTSNYKVKTTGTFLSKNVIISIDRAQQQLYISCTYFGRMANSYFSIGNRHGKQRGWVHGTMRLADLEVWKKKTLENGGLKPKLLARALNKKITIANVLVMKNNHSNGRKLVTLKLIHTRGSFRTQVFELPNNGPSMGIAKDLEDIFYSSALREYSKLLKKLQFEIPKKFFQSDWKVEELKAFIAENFILRESYSPEEIESINSQI